MKHDPLLYEDAQKMTEYVSQAGGRRPERAAVPLLTPGIDPYLEELVHNADRVWYVDEGPRTEAGG